MSRARCLRLCVLITTTTTNRAGEFVRLERVSRELSDEGHSRMIAARKRKKEKRAELEKRESNALMRENSEERGVLGKSSHQYVLYIFPQQFAFKTRERERKNARTVR